MAQPRGAKLQAQGRSSATNGELIFTLPWDVYRTTLVERSTSGNGSSIDDFQLTLIDGPAALFAFAPSLHGARLLPWRYVTPMTFLVEVAAFRISATQRLTSASMTKCTRSVVPRLTTLWGSERRRYQALPASSTMRLRL